MATKRDDEGKSEPTENRISLTPPWAVEHPHLKCTNIGVFGGGLTALPVSGRQSSDGGATGTSTQLEIARLQAQAEFVKERTRLHETYIAEKCRNQRLALILAFLLIVAAAASVLFAPPGREVLSYWLGAALLVFAAGASGYGRIWAKAPGFSVGAGEAPTGINGDLGEGKV